MAVTDAHSTPAHRAGALARLRAMLGRVLGGSGEASLTKRLAGTIFIIRVVSAGLAYLSQILLARWMGGSDYGVYVYVWTWVLLLGSMMDFGISVSAQKLIPEYRTQRQPRSAARLPLRQPLDDVHRLVDRLAAARRRRENVCHRGSSPARWCRSISAA